MVVSVKLETSHPVQAKESNEARQCHVQGQTARHPVQLRRERPSVALLVSWSRYEIPKDHHLRVVAHPCFHPMASLHNPSLRTLTSAH